MTQSALAVFIYARLSAERVGFIYFLVFAFDFVNFILFMIFFGNMNIPWNNDDWNDLWIFFH